MNTIPYRYFRVLPTATDGRNSDDDGGSDASSSELSWLRSEFVPFFTATFSSLHSRTTINPQWPPETVASAYSEEAVPAEGKLHHHQKPLVSDHDVCRRDSERTAELLQRVTWLPRGRCYRVPRQCYLNRWSLYQQGRIIGMDPSSMATVAALDVGSMHQRCGSDPSDTACVLDLCCCPGMKTRCIAEEVEHWHRHRDIHQKLFPTTHQESSLAYPSNSPIKVIGVDISLSRLFVARSLLSRSSSGAGTVAAPVPVVPAPRGTMLIQGDARWFDPLKAQNELLLYSRRTQRQQRQLLKDKNDADSSRKDDRKNQQDDMNVFWVSPDVEEALKDFRVQEQRQQQKRKTFRKRDRAESSAANNADKSVRKSVADGQIDSNDNRIPFPLYVSRQYQRILIDAECTHDGSLSHVIQSEESYKEDTVGSASSDFQASLSRYKPNYHLHEEEGNSASKSTGGTERLPELQYSIVRHAFCNLLDVNTEGSSIVYSTCTYSNAQNEGVVERLLREEGKEAVMKRRASSLDPVGSSQQQSYGSTTSDNVRSWYYAKLVNPFSALCGTNESNSTQATRGVSEMDYMTANTSQLPMCVRLDPSRTGSSFQFIAKITAEKL